MALTMKRDDKLTSLFDKFATLPEDKQEGIMAQQIKARQAATAKAEQQTAAVAESAPTTADHQPEPK
ncbi:SPJ_0845 family protein [Lapidilactobacillus luobeiensis]|uniref:SPJ_0845 family protein n=1 Tax=Lapidilactobacillus luobeiensis TaxID=2950371 RepID=UPI0021C3AA97|nr:SPJ_0845 family protein [Lapidilactobacillus luobeiensis]